MNKLPSVLEAKRPVHQTMGLTGCANCKLFKPCGGHPDPITYAIGCANFTKGFEAKTDDMNPNSVERFWKLWDDVDGLVKYSVGKLRSINATGLPRYVPQLQGRHLHPPRPLEAKVVALRLFQVMHMQPKGRYGLKFQTAEELRAAYRLSPDTRVILVGVDEDPPLERFWQLHRSQHACEALAQLGLEVTIPNFSFFTNVPRFQILRNRKRLLLSAERLSNAGVSVALHINAITKADWDFWITFLREHNEVTTVALEFQTGPLANQVIGEKAFNDLDDLIDRVGRPLHILMVGAGRFYPEARKRKWRFTVIDSKPFMFAQSRRVLERTKSGTYALRLVPTRPGASVYHLFESNLRVYEKALQGGIDSFAPIPKEDPNQSAFLW